MRSEPEKWRPIKRAPYRATIANRGGAPTLVVEVPFPYEEWARAAPIVTSRHDHVLLRVFDEWTEREKTKIGDVVFFVNVLEGVRGAYIPFAVCASGARRNVQDQPSIPATIHIFPGIVDRTVGWEGGPRRPLHHITLREDRDGVLLVYPRWDDESIKPAKNRLDAEWARFAHIATFFFTTLDAMDRPGIAVKSLREKFRRGPNPDAVGLLERRVVIDKVPFAPDIRGRPNQLLSTFLLSSVNPMDNEGDVKAAAWEAIETASGAPRTGMDVEYDGSTILGMNFFDLGGYAPRSHYRYLVNVRGIVQGRAAGNFAASLFAYPILVPSDQRRVSRATLDEYLQKLRRQRASHAATRAEP